MKTVMPWREVCALFAQHGDDENVVARTRIWNLEVLSGALVSYRSWVVAKFLPPRYGIAGKHVLLIAVDSSSRTTNRHRAGLERAMACRPDVRCLHVHRTAMHIHSVDLTLAAKMAVRDAFVCPLTDLARPIRYATRAHSVQRMRAALDALVTPLCQLIIEDATAPMRARAHACALQTLAETILASLPPPEACYREWDAARRRMERMRAATMHTPPSSSPF